MGLLTALKGVLGAPVDEDVVAAELPATPENLIPADKGDSGNPGPKVRK